MPVLRAKIDGAWVTVGGGVATGGTTNQLLAKASAADYDTAWTSAPVLTDLSIVDTTTPTLILQRTEGSPPIAWKMSLVSSGALSIWHGADGTGSNLYMSASDRSAGVDGDFAVGGKVTTSVVNSPGTVALAAYLSIGAGSGLIPYFGGQGNAGWARTATGKVHITYYRTFTNVIVIPAASFTSGLHAYLVTQSNTGCDIGLANNVGTHADDWLSLIVVGW